MVVVDAEQHVCQSCGVPMNPEDYAEGSEKGDFCSFCMVHNEFAADRDAVKARIADRIQDMTGKPRDEAEVDAEDTMKGLNRWVVG